MGVTIRQAGLADTAVIVEFNRLLALETEGKALDLAQLGPGVAAVLADEDKGLYFLAEEDGRPLGQIGLTWEYSDWRHGWFWWIQSVYVRQEARKKGVFRALYGHVEEMGRRDPEVIGLRLYVEDGNTGAQETYFKLGMTRTGYLLLEKYPLARAAPHPKIRPMVVVLAGSNGAGKTTAARTILAERLKLMTFVNADIIAQGLAGFNPDTAAAQAGRVMLQRLEELSTERANFALETTLSGLSLAASLQKWKRAGYTVHLVYFWLGSADLAVARVAERVRKGGHHVPEETIRRRYQRSLQNFFKRYRPLADSWQVYNNTAPNTYELIAHGKQEITVTVLNAELWRQFERSG
jgi:predicted ABC-type ATPase/GNAT superfamily N-acetyltransferase